MSATKITGKNIIPPCPEWVHNAVFYQIYPQTFYDSNGDGIGDLQGIIEKLDYIKSLGVDGIWINPFFASPFYDAGYDISDYYQVAPRYGTNGDARRLFEAAHKQGLKVLFDFVASYTSIEHPWFKESCRQEKKNIPTGTSGRKAHGSQRRRRSKTDLSRGMPAGTGNLCATSIGASPR